MSKVVDSLRFKPIKAPVASRPLNEKVLFLDRVDGKLKEASPDGSSSVVVVSSAAGISGATAIGSVIALSQEAYDAIPSADSATLYIITE
jgi:hypothetical protein